MREEFIEDRIFFAVKGLLTGRVNSILKEAEFPIPIIDFADCGCGYSMAPLIFITECERSEKERIVRLDTFKAEIHFSLPETEESELYSYAYAGAVSKAVSDNPTISGVCDRAVITSKKYIRPKKVNCGENWEVILTIRLTVEQ